MNNRTTEDLILAALILFTWAIITIARQLIIPIAGLILASLGWAPAVSPQDEPPVDADAADAEVAEVAALAEVMVLSDYRPTALSTAKKTPATPTKRSRRATS